MTDRGGPPQPGEDVADTIDQPAGAGPPTDASFTALYREQLDFVWRLLRRFGVRERDMEDLAHDVFVAVHGSWGRYDPARPLRPWLYGVAFRVTSDYRRRARFSREVPSEHSDQQPSAAPDAFAAVETAERRALVAAALEELPLDQLAVFVAHELEGETVPTIAAALSIPDNTCYSRLRLARGRFEAAVRRLAADRSTLPPPVPPPVPRPHAEPKPS